MVAWIIFPGQRLLLHPRNGFWRNFWINTLNIVLELILTLVIYLGIFNEKLENVSYPIKVFTTWYIFRIITFGWFFIKNKAWGTASLIGLNTVQTNIIKSTRGGMRQCRVDSKFATRALKSIWQAFAYFSLIIVLKTGSLRPISSRITRALTIFLSSFTGRQTAFSWGFSGPITGTNFFLVIKAFGTLLLHIK